MEKPSEVFLQHVFHVHPLFFLHVPWPMLTSWALNHDRFLCQSRCLHSCLGSLEKGYHSGKSYERVINVLSLFVVFPFSLLLEQHFRYETWWGGWFLLWKCFYILDSREGMTKGQRKRLMLLCLRLWRTEREACRVLYCQSRSSGSEILQRLWAERIRNLFLFSSHSL